MYKFRISGKVRYLNTPNMFEETYFYIHDQKSSIGAYFSEETQNDVCLKLSPYINQKVTLYFSHTFENPKFNSDIDEVKYGVYTREEDGFRLNHIEKYIHV